MGVKQVKQIITVAHNYSEEKFLFFFFSKVIWAVGKLNQRFESSYHSEYLKSNKLIDFGRQPFWNCPLPDHEGKTSVFTSENKQTPHAQQLNRPSFSRTNSSDGKQPSSRPVPTPKPVEKRDSWEIPAVQCNGS